MNWFIKLEILCGKRHFKPNMFIHRHIYKCKRIYMIGYWATYGIRDYELEMYIDGVPYVWILDDHNGAYAEWKLTSIDMTTTGQIIMWSEEAREVYEKLGELQRGNS